MMKKTVAVVFGGRSNEHEVSCMSVLNVASAIDRDKYDIIFLGITKDGEWLLVDSEEDIRSGRWRESTVRAYISPDAGIHGMVIDAGGRTVVKHVDVIFPVLHGANGEDGTIQGLFEMSGIPYVGCGVRASADAMDKLVTKRQVEKLGITQAAYVPVYREDMEKDMDAAVASVEAVLPYPVFVKPRNDGSSCGVTKADDRESLIAALILAAEHDRKVLVEETIVGRELECAVLGARYIKDGIKVSGIGEILASAVFYDYDAKYNSSDSETVVDPELPEGKREEIRKDAAEIFAALDGFGLSRVDFFLKPDGTVVFNEINTLPGFTNISMYPMLWKAQGISIKELTGILIEMAFER